MLLPSLGSTNTVGFIDHHHAYTNGPQYKPITYSLKIEVAYSVEIFVRISKTARYLDTEGNSLKENKMFLIRDIKSGLRKVFHY
jgi:hypothetical protein